MDPDAETYNYIIKIIILFVLLILSAFFSSAETAFMTLNKIKLRQILDAKNKKYLLIEKILNNKDKMLSAVLIGNNAVNMFISSITSTIVYELYGNIFVSIATGIITIIVLIFGEIIPKTIANKNPEKITIYYVSLINIIIYIFTPFIFIINGISYFIMKILGIKKDNNSDAITEETLKTIVDVSQEEGIIEKNEHELIQNVFEFGDSYARDIMIPSLHICSIKETDSYDDIMKVFKEERYTRLVVYNETKSDVVGIINIRDMIYVDKENFDIKTIMRNPCITYEYKKISELLHEMKQTSNNMAIIIDEYGETIGLLTLEDILEELVGEIRDEYDEDELSQINKISENVYEIDGTLKLTDVNRELNLNLESEDYDTISGYIIQKLDKIPSIEDYLDDDNVTIQILNITNNRINKIKLTKKHSI